MVFVAAKFSKQTNENDQKYVRVPKKFRSRNIFLSPNFFLSPNEFQSPKRGETATLSHPHRQKQVVGLRRRFFVPRRRGKLTDEKAERGRRNRFVFPTSRISAPYIWGTVSVLLGFSWRITVSACLACFPHVSASLRAARPPCRAALLQKS